MPFRSSTLFVAIVVFCSFVALTYGDDASNKALDLALDIKTIEVLLDRLEQFPQLTKDDENPSASLIRDIWCRLDRIVTYENRDNLEIWVLIARWATARSIDRVDKSPYAYSPFFHIRRLRPDYHRDSELFQLMAKLNAIINRALPRNLWV